MFEWDWLVLLRFVPFAVISKDFTAFASILLKNWLKLGQSVKSLLVKLDNLVPLLFHIDGVFSKIAS